jgi:hypothetical protein
MGSGDTGNILKLLGVLEVLKVERGEEGPGSESDLSSLFWKNKTQSTK